VITIFGGTSREKNTRVTLTALKLFGMCHKTVYTLSSVLEGRRESLPTVLMKYGSWYCIFTVISFVSRDWYESHCHM
jgi:hypothetical protein